MYLAAYLNETGNAALVRKCTRMLASWRETINDVICCHLHTDEMKPSSFNRIMWMLDVQAREAALLLPDKLAQELVTNILVGAIKSWKTRSIKAARRQQTMARMTKPGTTVPLMKVIPYRGEETDEERVERLRQRSREYLARKGKRNTLY